MFYTTSAFTTSYLLPNKSKRLIGAVTEHQVKRGDFFQAIAEEYNVGFLALMAANPNVDPFLPKQGSTLHIPTQMLLPYAERKGIVVNLPELRLYYFPQSSDSVHVFPIGIGRLGLATPRTTSYIGDKRENPIWRPTQAMKERYLAENGVALADEVPPGPNNPFGKYALRLGTSQYLIHGTNQRFGIGMRASSGCIRMYDDDIKWLYDNAPLNTQVKIIDQPIKMSYEQAGLKLFEVHQPLTPDDEAVVENNGAKIEQKFLRFIGEEKWQQHFKDYRQPTGLVVEVK